MSINVYLETGGYAIFLTLMGGGGHAILSSRNRGGQLFFYSAALSATPPPLLKFMNSPLVLEKNLWSAAQGEGFNPPCRSASAETVCCYSILPAISGLD